MKGLAPSPDRVATVRGLVLRRDVMELRRVLGDSAVSGPITSAVLIFADSTLAELERSLAFTSVADAAGGLPSDRFSGPQLRW